MMSPTIRSSVDLPQPEGPISDTNSPLATSRSIPCSAATAPAPNSFETPRTDTTACVVGAIIGELPTGIQDGLGGAIINFNQYYTLEPQELWATNIVAATLGIVFFVAVVLAEKVFVHRAPEQIA